MANPIKARFLLFLFLLSGCAGLLAPSFNDPAPTGGTIRGQGSFAGGGVSGSATIYDMGGGAYIVRLSGFSAPQEPGLVVVVVSGGSSVMSFALKGSSGNQNYSMSYSGGGATFQKVKIHSNPKNQDLSEANLI